MIKLIALDVDGCLTDGSIVYTDDGLLIKRFNVKDGLGIRSWRELGGKTAIITGKTSEVVKIRAEELKIDYLYQGIGDKGSVLREIADKENLKLSEIAVIGDDMNDLKMIAIAGRSFTPNDGSDYVKSRVDTVLTQKGGDGAVRELIEMLLEEQGRREEFVALWS